MFILRKRNKKGYKIGPNMTFCNEEHSHLYALKKYPDTSLTNVIKRIRPDLVEKRNCTNCNREMTEGYVIADGMQIMVNEWCEKQGITTWYKDTSMVALLD